MAEEGFSKRWHLGDLDGNDGLPWGALGFRATTPAPELVSTEQPARRAGLPHGTRAFLPAPPCLLTWSKGKVRLCWATGKARLTWRFPGPLVWGSGGCGPTLPDPHSFVSRSWGEGLENRPSSRQ